LTIFISGKKTDVTAETDAMAESAALDKIYTATNALLDAQSKMNKEQVDTFAEVGHCRALGLEW
jgi:hypothetical protein